MRMPQTKTYSKFKSWPTLNNYVNIWKGNKIGAEHRSNIDYKTHCLRACLLFMGWRVTVVS